MGDSRRARLRLAARTSNIQRPTSNIEGEAHVGPGGFYQALGDGPGAEVGFWTSEVECWMFKAENLDKRTGG